QFPIKDGTGNRVKKPISGLLPTRIPLFSFHENTLIRIASSFLRVHNAEAHDVVVASVAKQSGGPHPDCFGLRLRNDGVFNA
ncbi:MAG: hypothetical protein LBS79_04645, partial [Tannerella sp.]|nr:hypothetical protein [Tannerella sp.]